MTQAQRRLGFFLFPSDVYNKTKNWQARSISYSELKWKQESKRAREIGESENKREENSEEYEVAQCVYSYVGVTALDFTDKLQII